MEFPSEDTLSRVFAALNTSKLEECFIKWARAMCKLTNRELIAIEGKRLRDSYDKKS